MEKRLETRQASASGRGVDSRLPKRMLVLLLAVLATGAVAGAAAPTDPWPARDEKGVASALDVMAHREFTLVADAPVAAALAALAAGLAPQACDAQEGCAVRILNDSRPFVWASRAFVYISSGLLDLCADKTEVAAAMSHALAHAQLGHLGEYYRSVETAYRRELSKRRKLRRTGSLVGMFGGILPGLILITIGDKVDTRERFPNSDVFSRTAPALEQATKGTVGLSGVQLVEDPIIFAFNREAFAGYGLSAEQKADETALDLLRKAGVPPQAYLAVLKKLAEKREDWNRRGVTAHLLDAAPQIEGRLKHVAEFLDKTQ